MSETKEVRPAGGPDGLNITAPTDNVTQNRRNVYAAARDYAKAGIYVNPVYVSRKDNGKKDVRPVGLWRDASSRSLADIGAWEEVHPDAGLLIDCGKSGLVVVDCDGPEGMANWRALNPPEPIAIVATAGGGEHWYYRANPSHVIGNDQSGKVGQCIDIRGLGGFVFAPPTTDGRGGWAWITEPDWTAQRTVPSIVIERMTRKEAPAEVTPSVPVGDDLFDDVDHQFTREQAVKWINEAGKTLKETKQGFNGAINNFAMACAHFPWVVDREKCAELMMRWLGKGQGWDAPDRDDLATINSAYGATEAGKSWVATEAAKPADWRDANPHWNPDGEAYNRWLEENEPAEERAARLQAAKDAARSKRVVDLTMYLDGTYVPPTPSIGDYRDCGHQLLYPGRWHSLIALNASGKSWFGLWHVVAELRAGHAVVYAHFEETQPGGTLERMRLMAPDLFEGDTLHKLFNWVDCSTAWDRGEFEAVLPDDVTLVLLDGINEACGQHGLDPLATGGVTAYRNMFVTPATKLGAAVLSLGHPPKARDRQGERHSFGSTGWLDVVDGVGFRMEAAKSKPIRRGADGYSMVYTVKDRYGQVEELGVIDDKREAGWRKLGAFHVDATDPETVRCHLGTLSMDDSGQQMDAVGELGTRILTALNKSGRDGRFSSTRALEDYLKADGVTYSNNNVTPALTRLAEAGQIEWPEARPRTARPGWLTAPSGAQGNDLFDPAV